MVTCGSQLEVGLAGEGLAGMSLVRLAGGAPRSRLLLAAVDLLVEDAGGGRSSLSRVVVTRGPGSFTGIRSGLATAHGLAVALAIPVIAYNSLLVQAARVETPGEVWTAQPARRGELYVQWYRTAPGSIPEALTGIEVMDVEGAADRGPWLTAGGVDLGGASRAPASRSPAEAALLLAARGVPGEPVEPLYVEGPPIAGGGF
ncbi:MAG: tRNA (adenosine(37)-N6)-threonylcarbamoyltransferase complex dimerization subunit type 1 TsaB [Acidobacteria bacterium]|nr:tRNA (adenosine(37)-N6)-threonylcarbamoyltransferase complex dimerization subunit type 1 TsaB [Acidobacteriota bacterium]